MLILIIIILGASLVLYTLLGGADFGAGILETFAGKREELTISRAIAPVWEANHVWLILAVVILFTGFPAIYASLSLIFHIPLMVVLLGIIMRGTAFTFRNYDVSVGRSRKYFTLLFRVSSFITPVFLGMIPGAMILGRISFDQNSGFYGMFMAPWFNPFCMVMGLFSASLFAYQAAIFLVGETRIERERIMYVRFSRQFMLITLSLGLLAFGVAELQGCPLLRLWLQSGASILLIVVAAILCPFIWQLLKREKNKTAYLRIGAGIQVTCILAGWFSIQFPAILQVKSGIPLDFYTAAAPPATLEQLLIALITGLLLVIPGFVYLFRVFKVASK